MLPIYHQKNTDRVAETVFKRNCLGVNSTLAFPGANFGLLSPVASLSAPLSASLPPSCCLSRKLSGLMPHPLCSLTPYPVSLSPLALLALVGSRSVPFWEPPREEETCKQYQRRADVDAFCCQPRSLDCIGAASAPHCVTRANCRSQCTPLPSCLIGIRDSSSSPRLLSFAPGIHTTTCSSTKTCHTRPTH